MENLHQQVEHGKIWPLKGGVYPPHNKACTSEKPIGELPIPEQLIIPLKQHIGVEGNLLVKVGDHVLKGQALTAPSHHMSLPVHAPTSGQISQIAPHVIPHASGLTESCIFITPDHLDTWTTREPDPDHNNYSPEYLVNKLKMAGVSGLGGAGFPAYVKSASLRKINYLIINATECEPYISADDALIRRDAESIIRGIDIIASLVNPEMILIGIEDDKPVAIQRLQNLLKHRHDIELRVFPSKYPSGGEKQLIQILTGRQVPSGGLPIDVGILVHNIGTLKAVYTAIVKDEPCISRIITVTGGAIKNPQNVEVLIGTPIRHLLDHCGFKPEQQQRVIVGGPMMGFTINTTEMPIIKTTNCILAPTHHELPPPENEMDCIRCGACADVCPVSLLPQQLFWHSKTKDHQGSERYNLKDCIECGACAFVCPSEIPLVNYYRQAKAEIKAIAEEKRQAEQAKQRFEARKIRLAREAQERQLKQQQAAEKRKQALAQNGGNSAVADALARVKAKKAAQAANAAQHDTTVDTPQSSTATQAKLTPAQRAVDKAKAKQQTAEGANRTTSPSSIASGSEATPMSEGSVTPAQQAVTKAKQQAGEASNQITSPSSMPSVSETTPTPEVPLSPAQRAVARAKAKRQAAIASDQAISSAEASPKTEDKTSSTLEQPTELTPAQRAVAKAKARQLAQQTAQTTAQTTSDSDQKRK